MAPVPTDKKPIERSGQSLCQACGLCCDGTITFRVKVWTDDDIAPLAASGIQIYWDKNTRVFKQPCAAHKNCICTIYKDRPRSCRDYECRLLERFKGSEISQDEALGIIRKAVSLKDEVQQQMLSVSGDKEWRLDEFGEGLTKIMTALRSAATDKDYAQLFRSFVALQWCLDQFFRQEPMMPWPTPPSSKKSETA
jgi:Fe-S-cluster containining protein